MVHATEAVHFGKADEMDAAVTTRSRRSHEVDVEAQSESRNSTSNHAPPMAHLVIPGDSEENDRFPTVPHSPTQGFQRAETSKSRMSTKSHRRRGRTETSAAYGAIEMGRATGWAPGAEPGIDTTEEPAPAYQEGQEEIHESTFPSRMHQQCEITIVDYSTEDMAMRTLDNENLKDYLEQPSEDWSQVRWINVNGLSWDVIKVIGSIKGLHRLAIEDLMNTRNRTKADFYNDHTFVVLPLQRLVNIEDAGAHSDDDQNEDSDMEHDYDEFMPKHIVSKVDTRPEISHERKRRMHAMHHMKKHKGAIGTLLREIFFPKKTSRPPSARTNQLHAAHSFRHAGKVTAPWVPKQVRTLQQYHSGPNQDRIEFMERHSTLGKRGLGVSVEQVSIFLTSDNTVISFFEYSAQEVELPILKRLQSQGTILRQSCDASMLMQSILDTIVDLAIPVTTAYQDAIGDLELAVLTDPDILESTALYILTSEIAVLRNAIAPINQLIGTLKEHKPDAPAFTIPSRTMSPLPETGFAHKLERPSLANTQQRQVTQQNLNSGCTMSPLTITYLGDVEDHIVLIQDSYDQMRRNADNLVDLIFNTVSAFQNESMKQLTIVTCFFLPLSFMTGYFGMNFDKFAAVQEHSDAYFWRIAGPVCGVVILLLLREWIFRWIRKVANRALIRRGRKRRLARTKKE